MTQRSAVIETSTGTIRFELLETDAPRATENFITLAGRGYYDGVIFHRVIKGFMIQGGDPTGTGRGGDSAWGGRFDDEIDAKSELYKQGYKAGTVAMVNAGPDTNRSQFLSCTRTIRCRPTTPSSGASPKVRRWWTPSPAWRATAATNPSSRW